jgi:hypothetical protein
MSSLARAVTFGMALLAVIALMAGDDSRRAYGRQGGNAQKDILKLAEMLAAGKNIAGDAAALKKKYEDLEKIMDSYKPGNKGGIGYGKKKEGIELKLNAMGKRALAAGTLKGEKDDLLKMAYINLAIAEVASHYAPAKPKAGKGAKEWKQYTSDQKKAAEELIKAIEASSPEKVKAAANNINSACNGCHADFRD